MKVNVLGLSLNHDFEIDKSKISKGCLEQKFPEAIKLYLLETMVYGQMLSKSYELENPIKELIYRETEMNHFFKIIRDGFGQLIDKKTISEKLLSEKQFFEEFRHDLRLRMPFSNIEEFDNEQEKKELRKVAINSGIECGMHYKYISQAGIEELYKQKTVSAINLKHASKILVARKSEANDKLKINLDIEKNIKIYGSKPQIYKFLNNAIGNAEVHGGADKILITAKKGRNFNGGSYIIEVEDNGKGFPEGITNLEQRGVTTGTPGINLGLGMYIMNKIAKNHDGIFSYGGTKVGLEIPTNQKGEEVIPDFIEEIRYKLLK